MLISKQHVPTGDDKGVFMKFSFTIPEGMRSRCAKIQKERGDATLSETLRYLINAGIDSLERTGDVASVEDVIDARLSEFERSIRRENDAVLDKATAKLDKAVGKVSSIQKQAINAAGASSGSLIAAITLLSCYIDDHPEGHGEWTALSLADRWRFFFGTGRQLAFEKDAMRDFFHAFKDAPERCGNELASLADLYCEGDDQWAESLMTLPDTVGLDYLARHSAKEGE